jgi:hypothetical protein
MPDDDYYDRHVTKNFLVALDHQHAFNGILTVVESTMLTAAIRNMSFHRRELKNFAFLSAILPMLRSGMRYALSHPDQIMKGVGLINEIIHTRKSQRERNYAALCDTKTEEPKRYNLAMLG